MNIPIRNSDDDRAVTQLPAMVQELTEWLLPRLADRVTYSIVKRRYFLDGKQSTVIEIWSRLVDPLFEGTLLSYRFGNVRQMQGVFAGMAMRLDPKSEWRRTRESV